MTIATAKYEATVTFNDDPDKRGIIRVSCIGLLGNEDEEIPVDVEPVHDWGWFFVPDIGEIVEIEVVEGTSEDEQAGQSSIDQLNLRWHSRRFYGGTDTDTPRSINEDFTKKNYGKRRGFATPAGHVFMFDDTEGQEEISLKWQNKAGENSFFSMDKDGSIILASKTGTTLFFNAVDGETSIIDEHGNTIVTDSVGIRIIEKTGNTIEFKEGAIIVLGQSAVTISCKDAVIDAGNIELAGNTEACVLGTSFLPILNAHIHPTGVGPSGPPTPLFLPTILSTKVSLG